jgi:hypothetical protein
VKKSDGRIKYLFVVLDNGHKKVLMFLELAVFFSFFGSGYFPVYLCLPLYLYILSRQMMRPYGFLAPQATYKKIFGTASNYYCYGTQLLKEINTVCFN